MTIRIIAPNIKSGGGKELLEYLIEYINQNYPSVFLAVYADRSLKNLPKLNNGDYVYMKNKVRKIYLFSKKFDNAIYFGNLPPLKKSNNSMVYFHNPYLLMSTEKLKSTSLKFFVKYTLQQKYIKTFVNNIDFVACQNEEIKKSFTNLYHFSNVKVIPFFRLCDQKLITETSKIYDFCYVSLAHAHKQHDELIDAINILSDKNIPTTLALTIESGHDDLIKKIDSINKKGIVNIINLGLLSKKDVCKLYSESKALVFPSTQETFGLALIEAVKMGLDIIASDMEYVYKVVEPSLVFDPDDPSDIASKLIEYIRGDVKRSTPLIENKIAELVDTIIQGDEKNVYK